MVLQTYYKVNALTKEKKNSLENILNDAFPGDNIIRIDSELCYYIEHNNSDDIDEDELKWILSPSFEEDSLSHSSHLSCNQNNSILIEIGPRLNFSTPFSSNATSIFHYCGLTSILRVEYSIRYKIVLKDGVSVTEALRKKFAELLHDKMTECEYVDKIKTLQVKADKNSWFDVDVLKQGKKALQDVSKNLGLAFDDWDLEYYTEMFKEKLKRNPTSVECFDLAQSNSEHSRHWFFKGQMIIDGKVMPESLMEMVMNTQKHSNQNNVIKFADNSSAIKGFQVPVLTPSCTFKSSNFISKQKLRDILFTAETHNFPTGVCPFSGATTGTGGRIRDVHAAGCGSHVIAGTAGYCFGNLNIPSYELPWEDSSWKYPENFARPLNIAIEASNGASDYGNKFGEPVIAGFARSFGMVIPNEERREWIKPIMFTGGIGQIDEDFISKKDAKKGMKVVKIGGPVYRIGVGGGAASSMKVQGSSESKLDFDAVQRGDAEMAQKLNRFVRGCIESSMNPICSIHDQGAGGNGNVLKEICEPAGATIYADKFQLGDPTVSIMELWGAEYQESDAILVNEESVDLINSIAKREKCPISVVGDVTDTEHVILKEDSNLEAKTKNPVDLSLHACLPSGIQKKFNSEWKTPVLKPLTLPDSLTLMDSLERVLRLPSVASKRYLVVKVDRSVTGLIAQQQCVGPLHTPISDVAVTAISYFDKVGSATAIGEQPIKGLLDPAAGARLSVAESLTNLVFAKLSDRKDIKCSSNWMWAAKLPSEASNIYTACKAMCEIMSELGIAVDGGKDSLSMAAKTDDSVVKAPGALVVSTYAPCIDIESTITPDLKCPDGKGCLLHVVVSSTLKNRLGGSAFAQTFCQLGNDVPDVDNAQLLSKSFDIIQDSFDVIVAGHDVSDGGLIGCILEMCFAGNCGVKVQLDCDKANILSTLFSEEVGWVLEVGFKHAKELMNRFKNHGIVCYEIGTSFIENNVTILRGSDVVLELPMTELRDIWEETSFKLDLLQASKDCVLEEKNGLHLQKAPNYYLTFVPESPYEVLVPITTTKVAVIREEGTNGDREMAAALFMAGFEVWDVTMQDLINNEVILDNFSGIIFPGGFSYADVLGSAKGWAASFLYNKALKLQLQRFYDRDDTFSLGICNGCQLMALLGFIAPSSSETFNQGVVLTHNVSGRFESRFSTVKINKSPSIMFNGMEESILGVWVAHAEGQFKFKNQKILNDLVEKHLIPIQYVDHNGHPTTSYPHNPNGSVNGIGAICSENGRHLAMMPHPERCVLKWQWPYMNDVVSNCDSSPWLQMFHNAYKWCQK